MAMVRQTFDNYRIHFYSYVSMTPRVHIFCYNSNRFVGAISFLDSPNYGVNPVPGGAIHLRYPVSQFDSIVGILRYEKPLYLEYETNLNYGVLSTSMEPVGELEPQLG